MTGPTTLEATGERLIDHGYRIVPIQPGGKWPVDSGWSSLNADPDALAKWIADGRANWGVGILAEDTPGIDIDVKDSAVVDRLLAWCRDNGLASGQRVGNSRTRTRCHSTAAWGNTDAACG